MQPSYGGRKKSPYWDGWLQVYRKNSLPCLPGWDVSFFFDNKVEPVLQALCGRNEQRVKAAAAKIGWLSYETDWRKLVERDDIDLIDIVTPNNNHAEIAIAAAEAGKHVYCEKPLTMTLEQSKRMLEAVEKNGVIHLINYNYRFAPAVQFAKKLIESGRLGKIYHMRATYLQDWIMDPNFPLVWRLNKEVCGYGSHGDLVAHSIDLARFLVGEFKEVDFSNKYENKTSKSQTRLKLVPSEDYTLGTFLAQRMVAKRAWSPILSLTVLPPKPELFSTIGRCLINVSIITLQWFLFCFCSH